MNSLNILDANDMQSYKLGDAIFDEYDIFTPPSFDEQIYYDVYYREGTEIPLRYSEWQILILICANPTNTFGDTCRASL